MEDQAKYGDDKEKISEADELFHITGDTREAVNNICNILDETENGVITQKQIHAIRNYLAIIKTSQELIDALIPGLADKK